MSSAKPHRSINRGRVDALVVFDEQDYEFSGYRLEDTVVWLELQV